MRDVNPEVVRWALDWNGLDADELAKSSRWKFLASLLDEGKKPTFKQIEQLAARTYLLTSDFFDNAIPSIRLPIPDFRTHTKEGSHVPSPELFETINEQLVRQGWMSDYFYDVGCDQLEFVGKFDSAHSKTEEIVAYLRNLLDFDQNWAHTLSLDGAVRKVRSALEAQRISVAVSGYARNNTRRTLNTHEFRGFVLSDKYAPAIFINGNDAKVAQIFTMVHELVHLLFSESGLVDTDGFINKRYPEIERICDQIAAEFLAPADEFCRVWNDADNQNKAIEKISKYFKISSITCIRRALEVGLISQSTFWRYYNDYSNKHIDNQLKKKSGGGNPYNTYGLKLGTVFTDAIFTAVKSMYLQYRDAYRLTGLRAKTFDKYFEVKGYTL